MENRIIGIRHRRKKTAEGEARPTTVFITGYKNPLDLETETDELDFLLNRFPVDHEPVGDQDVDWVVLDRDGKVVGGTVRPHQCKWKKVKKEEVVECRQNHIRQWLDEKGLPVTERITKIPCAFDGLRQGDKVAMVLGGSGDRFASALSRRCEEIGSEVFRIPPFQLKEKRGDNDKDDDHKLLAELLAQNPHLFQKLLAKDRALIRVREAFFLRQDAQRARIGCEQRLYQSLVGRIFLSEDGKYPEGLIEDQYDQLKASDTILQGLLAEEKRREAEMKQVVRSLEIWEKIFDPIEGCGERIAAGIISALGDIRRFVVADGKRKKDRTIHKVKAFCGVHVMQGGKHKDVAPEKSFPRRRAGQLSNWSPLARQSLFLLMDQFNRRPGSVWGQKLLEYKEKLHAKYPEPIEVSVNGNGKMVKKFTKGHIHKTALWKTITKFVEWMASEWLAAEGVTFE